MQSADNLGVKHVSLQVNGTDIPVDAWGYGKWTFAAPGLYQIAATVVDTSGRETTETFEFTVSPHPGEEVIDFDLDLPEGTLSEAIEIKGE
ncbi:MAG: hypothetical protein J7524_23325, partial [Roseofilum sp. Belize BBD 4]